MIIRALKPPHDEILLPACLELLERTQGKNVTSLERLKKSLYSSDGLILVIMNGDRVLGVAGARILEGQFQYYLPFGSDIVSELENSKVGSFSTMGIDELIQGKGWGQKLSIERERWLRERGCNLLVGISWISGLAHTSDRVFEKRGFKRVNVVQNFFVESSIEDHLLCPVCKAPPCYCPGALYIKRI